MIESGLLCYTVCNCLLFSNKNSEWRYVNWPYEYFASLNESEKQRSRSNGCWIYVNYLSTSPVLIKWAKSGYGVISSRVCLRSICLSWRVGAIPSIRTILLIMVYDRGAEVAQLTFNQWGMGSNPIGRTNNIKRSPG